MQINPVFNYVTGSQFVIPGGIHGFSIGIASGSAVVNGVRFFSPMTLSIAGNDSKTTFISGPGIAVGATGIAASPCFASIMYW